MSAIGDRKVVEDDEVVVWWICWFVGLFGGSGGSGGGTAMSEL